MPSRECDLCLETIQVCPACGLCPSCQDWNCEACMTEGDRAIAYPLPTVPRFKVGDPVWAPNGEPRVVIWMRWVQARAFSGERQRQMPWGWALDTVHPDDDTWKGCGFEIGYRPREATLAASTGPSATSGEARRA